MPASTSDVNPGPAVSTSTNLTAIYGIPGSGAAGGATTGLSVPVTITAASTNDYNPGSGFPTGIGRLDITPSTNDVTLTGLLAGTDGQQVIIRNVGSTYNVILSEANASSAAANQFYGQGTGSLPPGNQLYAVYNASPSPRWSIG